MPIQVKCPNADCGQILRVKDELAGMAVRCPTCKTALKIPAAPSPASVPEPVAAAPAVKKAAPPPPAPPAPPPAPVRDKVSAKPPPPPPAGGKKRPGDAPANHDDLDEFTDEKPKKGAKSKKDDYDDRDDPPKKAGKAKREEDLDDYDDRPAKGKKGKGDPDEYDDKPAKGKKGKGDPDDQEDDDRPAKGKKRKDDLDDLPDTLWEDCGLFRHRRLSTKGKFSLWKNSFRIFNADTDEEVGAAEENLPTWKGWLRMFKAGPIRFANWLTIDVEVREDPEGPVLFYIRKMPNPMPWNLTTKIHILDFRKKLIGYFQTKLFSLFGGFWIYDHKDRQVAELKGKFSFTKPRMDFFDAEGELLGDITATVFDDQKKKKGFQMIFGAMPYVMTMSKDIEDHIPTKILFLAATMATQLAHASQKVSIGS